MIMTISDDEEDPAAGAQPAEPSSEEEEASEDDSGSGAESESGASDAGSAAAASFQSDFHFEASDSDSDEEEEAASHSWDLSDARAAAVQKGGIGTALRDKIDATLRRKGPAPEAAAAPSGPEAADEEDHVAAAPAPAAGKKRRKPATASAEGTAAKAADAVVTARPTVAHSGKGWHELALCRPLLRAVKDLGFERPTPIQAASIPLALAGRDICGAATTGSGKTAAFMLPVLERLVYRPRRIASTRVLVVTPTRELAVQIHAMTTKLGQHTDVRVAMAVGGLSLQTQETSLRTRPDIVVATPGRMIDLIRNSNSISMEELEILILDEADRLLDLGFADEVEELVKLCPRGRQTMLFSATMSENVKSLASLSLNNPAEVRTEALYATAGGLRQQFVRLRKGSDTPVAREAVLASLCSRSFKSKTIVFFRAKRQAHRTTILFGLLGAALLLLLLSLLLVLVLVLVPSPCSCSCSCSCPYPWPSCCRC